jgi:hypothetical protein
MQKTTLVLGSVGAVLVLVACAAGQDEGAASAGAADTTNTPATTTNTTSTGRTTTPRTTGTATRNASDGGTAPLTCYGGLGSCDPTNPAACGNGETCDINGGTGLLECFPPPNDAHLGDACDNGQGPFCSAGLACDQGTCKTYCCDDSLCAAGTTCQKTGEAGSIVIQVCK